MKKWMILLVCLVLIAGCGKRENGTETETVTCPADEEESTAGNETERPEEEKTGLLTAEEASRLAKTELSALPEDYTAEQAEEDGAYVVIHGQVRAGQDSWENFLEQAEGRENGHIIIAQCTVEGDTILLWLGITEEGYYYCLDSSRDQFSSGEDRRTYREGSYAFLKQYEENGMRMVMLVQDDTLTYEEIQTLWEQEAEEPDVRELFAINVKGDTQFNCVSPFIIG